MMSDRDPHTAGQILGQQVERRRSERFHAVHELADKTIDEANKHGFQGLDLALLGGLLIAEANHHYVREQLSDLTLRVNYLCQKLDVTDEELYAYIEFLPDEESDADSTDDSTPAP